MADTMWTQLGRNRGPKLPMHITSGQPHLVLSLFASLNLAQAQRPEQCNPPSDGVIGKSVSLTDRAIYQLVPSQRC